jgi:hypothetical protein
VKRKATGCAGLKSEGGEIDEVLSGRVQEDKDWECGKLSAELLDGIKGLKIGGVKIEDQGVPRGRREGVEGRGGRRSALNRKRNKKRLGQSFGDFQPGGIVSQEEATERLSEHRSS